MIIIIKSKGSIIYNLIKREEPRKMMLKILVIGNSYSGKTSLVNRFVQNKFDPNYKATVACDFSMKILKIDEAELRL